MCIYIYIYKIVYIHKVLRELQNYIIQDFTPKWFLNPRVKWLSCSYKFLRSCTLTSSITA